jgi:ADP-heptose:LPS heptosyltransferase
VSPLLPYATRAPHEFERHPASWARLRAWLPRQRFDLAVSLRSEVLSGALLAAWSHAPVRAVANASRTLPAFNLVLGSHDHHNLRRYWRAAWRLGVTWPEQRPIVVVPAEAQRRADEALQALDLAGDGPLVGVGIPNRGTGTRRFKLWSEQTLAAFVEQLAAAGARVVLIGAGSERPEADGIAARVPHARVTPTLSLAEVAGVQRRLTLLVSNFTGTLHLADGVGTPTVAIGETRNAADWRLLGPRHRLVASQSVATIPIEEVLAAVREALSQASRDAETARRG